MSYAVYGRAEKRLKNSIPLRCAVRADVAMQRAADLGRCPGGVMRVKRAIIIPAILALSVAGSILAGSSATGATHVNGTHYYAAGFNGTHYYA
jgi:hypothetical protein